VTITYKKKDIKSLLFPLYLYTFKYYIGTFCCHCTEVREEEGINRKVKKESCRTRGSRGSPRDYLFVRGHFFFLLTIESIGVWAEVKKAAKDE